MSEDEAKKEVKEKTPPPEGMDGFDSQEAVLELIGDCWEEVSKKGFQEKKEDGQEDDYNNAAMAKKEAEAKKAAANKSSSWFSFGKNKSTGGYGGDHKGAEESDNGKPKTNASGEKQFDIPQTFTEMVRLNAAMTSANIQYINIMLDEFGSLVRDTVRLGELQEQTDILAMRIAKDVKGVIKTEEFKVCMLASMRSLIPKRWDLKHEKAWCWLWDSINTQLKLALPLPAKYEVPVARWVQDENDDKTLGDIGLKVWFRMFEKEPTVENVFKQSNERLKWIAIQAMIYSAQIYANPTEMNNQMQALGLKHIMFRVNPRYFALFVACIDEEIRSMGVDENICNGMNWSLTVIACILARSVEAGSTPLLMAALSNNVKALKAELAGTARGKRGMSMLSATTS
jgi:hemoglobin-like flavoprotein